MNNFQDTEECENDTYLAAWNNIPPQSPNPLAAYLCRIARNLAIKRYEMQTAKKRNSTYDVALDELEGVFEGKDGNPADEAEARELTRILEAFLDTLSSEDRKLFVRRYWFACSVSELAEIMNWKPHRVSVRLSRILGRLRKYLLKEGVLS